MAVGVEQRRLQPLSRRLPLDADLALAAGGGLQPQVAAYAAGSVGNFGQRRGLEAAAEVGVDVEGIERVPHHAKHGADVAVGRAATVIGAGRIDEMVVNAKPHPAGAHAAHQLPRRMEAPVELRKGAEVGRGIGLVAAQRALRAVLVDVAVAAIAHAVGFEPGAPQQRQAGGGGGAPAP
ncbi:hypothetical protein D3C72_1729490 [compost metagenome]